jgi:hypothetical protein
LKYFYLKRAEEIGYSLLYSPSRPEIELERRSQGWKVLSEMETNVRYFFLSLR